MICIQRLKPLQLRTTVGHCMLPNGCPGLPQLMWMGSSVCVLAGKIDFALTWLALTRLLCCRSAPRMPAIDVRANRLAGAAFGAIGLAGAAPPPLAVRKLQRAKVQLPDLACVVADSMYPSISETLSVCCSTLC